MNYLWTIENLSTLTGHPEAKVKVWACERLRTLYREAGVSELKGLLKESDEGVLREVLDYLIEYPVPQFADRILDIYKREKGFIAGKAAMVLAKLKDDRIFNAFDEKKLKIDREGFEELFAWYEAMGELKTDEAIALLKDAVEVAGNKTEPDSLKLLMADILNSGKGLDFVLDYYLRHYKKSGTLLISALLDYCQFWHDDEGISDGKKGFFSKKLPPVVESAISMFKVNVAGNISKDLERLFRKEDFQGVIRSVSDYADNLMREAAAKVGLKAFSEWKMRESQPGINYNLIMALNKLSSHNKDALKGLSMVAMASFAGLDEMNYLIGLSCDTKEEALRYALLEDREDTVDDKWLENILLSSQERETIIEETVRTIRRRPGSSGTKRGVRLLGLICDERAIPCLVEIIGKKLDNLDDEAIDEAQSALAGFGEKALPALEALLDGDDHSVINECFFILMNIPVKKTEELLLKNWDRFMGIDRELFTMALEGVASKEFITPLRREIKEDELIEAEVFQLLCLIHGIKDPLLPLLEVQLKKADEEVRNIAASLKDDNRLSLVEAPLRLELGCLECGRAYFYKVEEVVLDPEKPRAKPEITDRITCKNCGSVNKYRLTDKGNSHLAIRVVMMAALLKEDKIQDPLALPIKLMKMRFMGNRPMSSFKEAMEEYRRVLEASPHDPALRVGYGNMLKRQGMVNEAEFQFREASRLEPNAVEAYTQLGEIEESRGNIHAAYEFYTTALQRMQDARYFRTSDVDGFKEMVVEKHHYLKQMVKGEADVNLIGDVIKIDSHLQAKKAGRNAPCPCGSGKKYKKCCLSRDEGFSHKTALTYVEKSLTERFVAFSFQSQFKKDFDSAYALYFKRPFRESVGIDEEQDIGFGTFLEWFIHDFVLKSGKTIVEEFYQDNFRRLSGEEREVLEAEMVSYLSIYEVTAVAPEEGVALRDLLTGEEFEVKDVSGSRQLVKWDIVITRAIRHETVNKLAGIVTLLPREDKERFMAALLAKWEKFRQETGKVEWKAFTKTRGHLLSQMYNERVASQPVLFTEEHHSILEARAEYDILDLQGIRGRLSNEFDFVLDEENEGSELQYTWLKRGKSEKWEKAQLPKIEGRRPIVHQTLFMSQGGEIRFTTLGTVRVTTKVLTLECISKERLERGKLRLKDFLGDLVRYRQDFFRELERPEGKRAIKAETKNENVEAGIDDAAKMSFMSRYFSQYMEEWINNPIQTLNGLSPLEACNTEAGRVILAELLKDLENNEERKRRDGEPYIDVNMIRERLKSNIIEPGK